MIEYLKVPLISSVFLFLMYSQNKFSRYTLIKNAKMFANVISNSHEYANFHINLRNVN